MATIQEALSFALALHQAGRFEQAEQIYRRILDAVPDHAEALHGMGVVWADLRDLPRAAACFQQVVQLRPDSAEANLNLGTIWSDQGKLNESLLCLQRAIAIRPEYAEAHSNLGTVWADLGKLDEAVACYRRALGLSPDYAEVHNNLGNALRDQGNLDEAVACFQRALALRPGYAAAHSSLLFTLQNRPGVTLSELAAAHADYERRHAAPLRAVWRPHEHVRDPARPLRLGFVSPDFGRHPVGYFLIRVLENLDRQACETFCYADRMMADDMTTRLRTAASAWRDVWQVSDECLAEQIRADRIDILFDLAGHTARNRLLVFARKPAPVQVTWMGYVGTTGLAAMDYILGDQYEIPPESERYYVERVLRLPNGYVCYDPPSYAPPVGPLPALSAGQVTFGSFNNPAKITPGAMACWAEILRRLPEARLILKYRGLGDRTTQDRFRSLFVQQGVDAARVELSGPSPHDELLVLYGRIDLALDTFPYNGGLTTCEALWMGVPVVTCPGETFAGRHSLSHLSNVRLTETIAGNLDEYVDLAVALAQDLPRLAALRAGLRQRVAQSPLCDGKQFAADLLDILRGDRHGCGRPVSGLR